MAMSMPRGRPRRYVAPCRFCQKQFKRHEHLERHERTHTREQPFVCHCGRRFSRQDLLSRHQRVSHAGEIDNPETPSVSDVNHVTNTAMVETTDNIAHGAEPQPQDVDASSSATWLTNDVPLRDESPDRPQSRLPQHGAPYNPNIPVLYDTAMGDLEPLQDSYTQDLLLGMDGLEHAFLWDDMQSQDAYLPTGPINAGPLLADSSVTRTQNAGMPSFYDLNPDHQEGPAFLQLQPGHTSPEAQSAFASRLPSMEPEEPEVMPRVMTAGPETPLEQAQLVRQTESARPWKVSLTDYAQIARAFTELRGALPDAFSLPSQHALSRFLEGYFRGFHIHLPFLHCVTFSAARVGPELLLSLAAAGALYRFEHAKGYRLYAAARSLIAWRAAQRGSAVLERLAGDSPGYAGYSDSPSRPSCSTGAALDGGLADDAAPHRDTAGLGTLQAMMVLMAMASWGHHDLTRDALCMSSQVAMLARDLGIARPEQPPPANEPWDEWVRGEERRRTLFVAYTLLNLQSVAFDTPPPILNREVAINLPGCASTWTARGPAEWSRLRDKYVAPGPFQEKLGGLLAGRDAHLEAALSSFGNHVLVHGLVQQIFLARGALGRLDGDFVGALESSLRAWQRSWEATYESTTDPSSPKGPLGFNSTALLRLAYIRLSADLGPRRRLLAGDPGAVADAFSRRAVTAADRSPRLDRAVLQCAHALSIPVRVGVAFVAHTRPLGWSIQHALCNLECAFLLAQWLLLVSECAEASGPGSLRGDERKLVSMVAGLVQETEFAGPAEDGGQSYAVWTRGLAASTVRLWAQTFQGSHVFEIVRLVGSGLSILADALESEASVGRPV
ncbi:hypothetical protein EsH8_I_001022 [Colletotrichum jinshuiense]